tara:strand:- start:322 stop:492 length:171 start_codon:yes stop_codon:yes gene_type:complete
LINDRRRKLKLSRFEEIVVKIDPANPYVERNDYLERSIYDTLKYFQKHEFFKSEAE